MINCVVCSKPINDQREMFIHPTDKAAMHTTCAEVYTPGSAIAAPPSNLIACPDCGRSISKSAPTCPGCGAPIGTAADLNPSGTTIPYSAQEVAVMLSKKPKTSHLLHLLLSIITMGLWVIVWILMAINNNIECARIDRRIANGKKIR